MAAFPIGGGQGLWSCPAGSGLLPGLHTKAAASTAALKGGGGVCVVPAALGTPGQQGLAGAGKSMMAGSMAKGAIAGGGMGKGLCLGLGIGLGLWGPAILAGLGAAAAYSLWRSSATINALNEDETEIGEALSGR